MKNTVTMMTKSLQSVVSKYFNVSYHTASLARRAVLVLSLVAFGLGSVWGQNTSSSPKIKHKTLIIKSTNAPVVKPSLISNWLELASDCGVSKQTLGDKLFVRWYFENQDGQEIEVSGLNQQYYTKINNFKGLYRDKSTFDSNNFDDKGNGGYYWDEFTLWSGDHASDYKNMRLVCVVSTKTDDYNPKDYNPNNWQDPEIQVKYVYTLILERERKEFAHYEGEAYRYLKEIGNDDQAKDYGYIEVDGSTPADNFTWNISTNNYNATPDTRNIRQNVHTVDYYYYVEPGKEKELLLPLQDYATGGQSSTEPMAYFRWYDYQTDMTSNDLLTTKYGNKLKEIDNRGYFAIYKDNDKVGEPNKAKIGATFKAPVDFSGDKEIQIACDVSRYLDGMDESFTYLVHEPTLSIRYLFHIMPAEKIAKDIAKVGSLDQVEADIRDPEKAKPTLILEDEGRTVVSTNNGYGEFALRTKLSSLDNYYYRNKYNELKEANRLWWYVYYYDGTSWWRHLIPNKSYLNRDGRPSYGSPTYRIEKHQAKYSLADKKWPDYNNSISEGDFKGEWEPYNKEQGKWGDKVNTTSGNAPLIGVGDRVQMVACVDYQSDANAAQPKDDSDIMPIIWTELEFINARPLGLQEVLNATEENASVYERTSIYMNEHYGDNKEGGDKKGPKALLDFNEFSVLGLKKPAHSYENYATVPLHYPNAQYGFIYPQLTGYCATQRDNGIFGMAPMHGDYTLLKSMNMNGISMDKSANNANAQSIMVDWVTIPEVSNNDALFDFTYERKNGKTKSPYTDSNDYGTFLYVDAADEARTIASLEFDASLCEDAKIYYTAYVASMTGLTRAKEVTGSTGWYPSENQTPQTAPSLRFRVSAQNENGERVPVVTFVTGNIRQEVNYDPVNKTESAYNNNGCPFKEAQWYQVYGYTTIPEAAGLNLNGTPRHFFVEIDNYCDNTDGADYCVDEISFYTDNCKVSVVQAERENCEEKGAKLNIYVTAEEAEKVKAEDGKIYWRICDNDGNPVMDKSIYGKFLVEGLNDTDVPYGATEVKEISLSEGITYGYFEKVIDGKTQSCFSIANMLFDLAQGNDHYISIFSSADHKVPTDGTNLNGWGNRKDICSVYSGIFIPKVMYVSVGGLEGGSTPSIDAGCAGHVADLVNFDIVLNVPDTKSETGFTPYTSVHFDFFKGTREELQEKIHGDGDKFSLEEAINYYRNYNGIADENLVNGKLPWEYTYSILTDDPEDNGLDPKFGENQDAVYYKYYEVIKAAVDAQTLYLSYSNKLSNLSVDKNSSTIWALSADVDMTDDYGDTHLVCSPLPLNFKVVDDLIDPLMTLGFDDVDYPEDYKQVVRVGLKQLEKMIQAENNYKLHIPVKSYGTKKEETYQEGAKANTKLYFPTKLNAAYLTVSAIKEDETDKPNTTDPVLKNDENGIGRKFAKIMSLVDDESPYVDASHMYLSLDLSECEIDFHEGYEYEVSTSFADKENPDKKSCIGDLFLVIKVVPEYVTWKAQLIEAEESNNTYYSANWYDDKNWTRSQHTELYKTSTAYPDDQEMESVVTTYPGYVPMKFTYVTLLTNNHAPSLITEPKVPGNDNQGGSLIDPSKETGTDMTSASSPFNENWVSVPTTHIRYDMMVRYGIHDDGGEGCFGHRSQTITNDVIQWVDDEDAKEDEDAKVFDVEKFYGNWAKEIYFKPSAELINQQYLNYDKAWVEKELEANKWYLMSTPLKATYAGDMYVPYNKTDADENGKQKTEAFEDIYFITDADADITYSRTGYPVYQKSWDHGAGTGDAGNVYTKDNFYSANLQFKGSVATTFAQWTHTYNDMAVRYDELHGFALRAHKNAPANATALLRLPKADETYTYYDYAGNADVRKANTPKTDGYARFVTDDCDESNRETARITKELHKNINAENSYYLIGNPYMASLDMAKFFKENSNLTGGYWTIDGDASKAGLGTGQVRPLESFFVKLKDDANDANNTSIIFTSAMMIDGNHPTPAPNPVRPMTMTAANDRGQSTATVSVGDEAKSVETLFDSNLSDVPMVYTVAGGQAVSINRVTELGTPIAFGVTCGSSEPVEVTFSDIEQLTSGEVFVVDAADGSTRQVAEGESYTVQPNDYGRYFLTFAGGTTGIEEAAGVKGIIVSVRNKEVTVTSAEELTQVRAFSLNGTTMYQDTDGGTMKSFALASGVYIIKAENAAGEQLTVKVIVK